MRIGMLEKRKARKTNYSNCMVYNLHGSCNKQESNYQWYQHTLTTYIKISNILELSDGIQKFTTWNTNWLRQWEKFQCASNCENYEIVGFFCSTWNNKTMRNEWEKAHKKSKAEKETCTAIFNLTHRISVDFSITCPHMCDKFVCIRSMNGTAYKLEYGTYPSMCSCLST